MVRSRSRPKQALVCRKPAQPASPRASRLTLHASPQFTALPPLSLYIHIPWCMKKCPYCDFNSHEVRGGGSDIPEQQYVAALIAEGRWDGEIIATPRGEGGFGYDPYFFLPARNKTAAELPAPEKNRISHRGKAWVAMTQKLSGLHHTP